MEVGLTDACPSISYYIIDHMDHPNAHEFLGQPDNNCKRDMYCLPKIIIVDVYSSLTTPVLNRDISYGVSFGDPNQKLFRLLVVGSAVQTER